MTSGTVGGFRGFVERDRPFIDDQPDRNYGWESKSRWGSRPVREFGRAYARGAARATSYSSGAWTRVKTALREMLLVGSCLACLGSFAEASTVPKATGHIEQFRLGFALGPEGGVSPGCAASTFSVNDPIHLSMEVTGATVGSVVRVSVRDLVTKRIAWSEAKPVTPGRSLLTFEIAALAVGRYRVEPTFDGAAAAAKPWAFEVHDRRPDVRAGVGHRAVLPPGTSVQVTESIDKK